MKQLRELLGMIGITVVTEQLGIADSAGAFDGEGRLARVEDMVGLDALAASVVRAATAVEAFAA